MSEELRKFENQARMFLANVFDSALMAIDLAKTQVYHGTPKEVAAKLRSFQMDADRVAKALEGATTFTEAICNLQEHPGAVMAAIPSLRPPPECVNGPMGDFRKL